VNNVLTRQYIDSFIISSSGLITSCKEMTVNQCDDIT